MSSAENRGEPAPAGEAQNAFDVETTVVYVGRQPIFDRDRQVSAYELLFRDSRNRNFFEHFDGDLATQEIVHNSLNVLGLESLTAERPAFYNFTGKLLLDRFYELLPRENTVVELLETVDPTPEIIDACVELKSKGYTLALDDFVLRPDYQPLLDLADVVKVDFMETDAQERRQIIRQFKRNGLRLLAEKVETQEEVDEAMKWGYELFQGFFFCKPEIVEGREIPAGKQNCMLFLSEVNRPEINFDRLEVIVRQEPSLSVKLLKYLNSAAMGIRQKVTSIHQGLVLMGERPLRRWGALVAMATLSSGRTPELMRTCLSRASFCESVVKDMGKDDLQLDAFMLGLLSMLDALLDQPIDKLLEQIPVAPDVRATLLGQETDLTGLYQLMGACERGDWYGAMQLGRDMGVSPHLIANDFRHAMHWAEDMLKAA